MAPRVAPDRKDVEAFWTKLLDRLGREGVWFFKPYIPSRTLQRALTHSIVSRAGFGAQHPTVFIEIPHYWSAYVHDGRPSVHPVDARYLVWFANPKDDPRTDGTLNYPVRKSQIRRLSPEAWDYWLEQNRLRREAGLPPAMIVTMTSGPVEPTPFFVTFRERFAQHVEPIIEQEFANFVRGFFPSKPLVAPPARVRLR